MMTHRERLLAVLRGDRVDRVPIWLLFPYAPAPYYTDVRANPHYRPVMGLADRYALTLNRRGLGAGLFAPEVRQGHEDTTDGPWRVRRQWIEYRGRRLWAEQRTGPGPAQIKKLLETEDDLHVYCSLPLNTDPARIAADLEAQLPRYLAERDAFPPEAGAMMLDLGEPIGPLYGSANLTEYPVWSVTCFDEITDWLDRHMQRVRIIYDWCLQRDLAEVYFLVGSELASPPMLSPATFDRWIVPYARELIERIHAHGRYAIQHYHGQIRLILPRFLEMGADALHTIEAPPTGDCTLAEAFEVVGDRIALIGNVQYDCFRSYTPAQMARAVRDVLAEANGRRLILSPSAGPYEHEISRRVAANYLAFLRAGWHAGQRRAR